jgi:nitrous-oxide reductase
MARIACPSNDGKILTIEAVPRDVHGRRRRYDKVAWQIIVDGNLDMSTRTIRGKYAFSTCYNSEEYCQPRRDDGERQDWVVIFNLNRIAEAVKNNYKEMAGCPCSTGARVRP